MKSQKKNEKEKLARENLSIPPLYRLNYGLTGLGFLDACDGAKAYKLSGKFMLQCSVEKYNRNIEFCF